MTPSGLRIMAAVSLVLAVVFGGLYLGDVSRLRAVTIMETLPLFSMVIAPWLIAAAVVYSGAVVAEAHGRHARNEAD